ncbi:class I SAM-dependent methyltransferase [Psychromicrobium lacuslunae]|uniref:SAM-dependent methyltransferase n=1 Tax=Psychromicrobium lacuslunae TaxID=1618207 RepID=A0A0D4BYF0_9MICC|nr:class I SAM-dependent methyltransferase [Psychromicrobium lacuslunae]AJT41116.1 SAM-dependent methyltransferase [Psychromicrobium lacuslunae]
MNSSFAFDRLRRSPDLEAANLFAWDASDLLLIDEAEKYSALVTAKQLVVIGDNYGALSLALAARYNLPSIRVHQDLYTSELALQRNAQELGLGADFRQLPLGAELLQGAKVIILQLPRSLAELEEIAQQIARYADAEAVLLAAGRLKHMSLAMNQVLAKYFKQVRAGLARQKSRLLTAEQPSLPEQFPAFPQQSYLAELELQLRVHGAVFAGVKLDIGTRYLLTHFSPELPENNITAVDLGCGSGVLAAVLARRQPRWRIIATDRSSAAVESARATAAANELTIEVLRDDAAASLPSASVDLIVLNPPFHAGSAVHSGVAHRLFEAASRLLKPNGQLWTVYNRHLAYRQALSKVIGRTELVAQNAKFVVTKSFRELDA